jgi:ecotin
LPEKKNSKDLKVEILTGKSVETDPCNRHFLTGQIEQKDLEGYGYTYYTYSGTGDVAGTMMACPDDRKITQVVYAQTILISYNSKLPIVIYIPFNMEVSYRIWKAEKKWKKATP